MLLDVCHACMHVAPNLPGGSCAGSIKATRVPESGPGPGTTPMEQPTSYELVVNAASARMLNLKVPQAILLRADRVIE